MPSSSPRARMADVARHAGVSVMSVSNTYNQPGRVSDSTRSKVLAAAEELGYLGPHPGARSLRSGRSNTLGVVLSEQLSYVFDDPGGRRFLAGIADACLDTDTALVLLPNSGSESDLDRIRGAQVDGYVLWTSAADDPVVDTVLGTGKPVCIQGGPAREGAGFVGIDDAVAARAVGAVTLRSASRPVVLAFPTTHPRESYIATGPDPDDATYPVTRARLIGYRDAAVHLGFEWDAVTVAVASGNLRSEGARLGLILIRDHGADAVLAMSDELALGVLDAARELGAAVPGQVSVSGWDDSPDSRTAGLTTVSQSLFDQGRTAARHALGTERAPVSNDAWTLLERGSTR